MSTVIIIGGGAAKHAIDQAETASGSWTNAQVQAYKAILDAFTQKTNDFIANPYPPA